MSTRATYQFKGEYGRDHTLYIHHDGYPEGAAQYFARACLHENARGGMAERMLRANDNAELTGSHDTHGDTEFRYTLHRPTVEPSGPDVLRVDKRAGWGANEEWRRGWWTGSLADFLNAFDEPSRRGSWRMLGRECTTVEDLTRRARERMRSAEDQLSRGWTGNACGSAGEAATLIGAGAEVPESEFRPFLERVSATFPHMVAYHMREAGLLAEEAPHAS